MIMAVSSGERMGRPGSGGVAATMSSQRSKAPSGRRREGDARHPPARPRPVATRCRACRRTAAARRCARARSARCRRLGWEDRRGGVPAIQMASSGHEEVGAVLGQDGHLAPGRFAVAQVRGHAPRLVQHRARCSRRTCPPPSGWVRGTRAFGERARGRRWRRGMDGASAMVRALDEGTGRMVAGPRGSHRDRPRGRAVLSSHTLMSTGRPAARRRASASAGGPRSCVHQQALGPEARATARWGRCRASTVPTSSPSILTVSRAICVQPASLPTSAITGIPWRTVSNSARP